MTSVFALSLCRGRCLVTVLKSEVAVLEERMHQQGRLMEQARRGAIKAQHDSEAARADCRGLQATILELRASEAEQRCKKLEDKVHAHPLGALQTPPLFPPNPCVIQRLSACTPFPPLPPPGPSAPLYPPLSCVSRNTCASAKSSS